METHTGYTGAGTLSPCALSWFARCVGASYLLEPRGLGCRLGDAQLRDGKPELRPRPGPEGERVSSVEKPVSRPLHSFGPCPVPRLQG